MSYASFRTVLLPACISSFVFGGESKWQEAVPKTSWKPVVVESLRLERLFDLSMLEEVCIIRRCCECCARWEWQLRVARQLPPLRLLLG